MTMIIYSEAGSTYDLYARILARHMGKHIPGKPTTFVSQNMPGAGGLKATEYLYNIAPKDGTVIGTISRGNPFEPMLNGVKANFEPLKFTWLGSMNREVALAVSWHTVPVKTIDDLKERELITPGTGAGADSQIIPLAINNLVGTKFKIIPGYQNTTRAVLAMEQGELEGIGYWSWSAIKSGHPDWITDKKINLIFRTGEGEVADLAGVPKISDHAKSDLDRQALDLLLAREVLGRPFLAPPALPPERAKALKAAFIASMKDPDLIAEAAKAGADLELVTGDEVETLLKQVLTYPPDVIERTKDVLNRIQ
jgi:tripartite-type tricarboxylate transporter receptor subunit TctC